MRSVPALWLTAVWLVVGCTDGVGRPIRANELSVTAAGATGNTATNTGSGGAGASTLSNGGGTSSSAIVSSTAAGGFVGGAPANGGSSANPATGGSVGGTSSSGGSSMSIASGGSVGGTSTYASAGGATGGATDTGSSAGGALGGSGPVGSSMAGAPAFCTDPQRWPSEFAALEQEMLNDINVLRESGYSCSGKPAGSAAPALTMSADLRCTARSVASGVTAPSLQPVEILAISEPSRVDVLAVLVNILNNRNGSDCVTLMDPRLTGVGIGFTVREEERSPGYWAIYVGAPPKRPTP